MRLRQRQIRRAALALVLGVITTIIIAWLAMFLPWNGQHWYGPRLTEALGVASRSDHAKTFQISHGRNAWHDVTSYWWMQVSGMSMMMTSDDQSYREIDLATLPTHMRPASIDDLNMQSLYHETGWPLPAMTCSVHWQTQVLNSNILYTVTGGVQLPRDAKFNPRALPLTPLWPGFAIDVLAYAGGWWMLMWTSSVLRRRVRIQRQLCTRCGYSRKGLPVGARCPECGIDP